MQNGEEAFRAKSKARCAGGLLQAVRNSSVLSTAVYIVLGIGLALVARQVMSFGLQTDMPVVAVVSTSMQHDNAQQTHYAWLESRLGYDRAYIDSWPIPTGFLVGDMPVVEGRGSYAVGDVIVYSVPGQSVPIIHRIIKVNADGTYETKGDNNAQQWPYEFSVGKAQIHGKVVAVIPKLGYFKVLTTSIFGL
jgi:signal peptidase I